MRTRPRLFLALALGAVTTVVVAWACALAAPSTAAWYTTLNINEHGAQPARWLNVQQDQRGGRQLLQLRIQYAIGPTNEDWRMTPGLRRDIEDAMDSYPEARGGSSEAMRDLYAAGGGMGPSGWPRWPGWLPGIPDVPGGLATFSGRAAGWPLPALRSTAVSMDPGLPARWSWSWRLLTADHYQSPADPQMGAVPLAPIPLNFLADSLLFGGAWWLMMLGPRDVQRWRRRRGGCCEACGYSLAGLPAVGSCPECGAQIRRLPMSAITSSTMSRSPSPPLG